MAAENPAKIDLVRELLRSTPTIPVLVIGMYLSQLHKLAEMLDAPLMTGETPLREREKLFDQLRARRGEIARRLQGGQLRDRPAGRERRHPGFGDVRLAAGGSAAAGPDPASEGERLLAHFYTLVSHDTVDQDYAGHRQMFLTEQGYRYDILYAEEVAAFTPAVIASQPGTGGQAGGGERMGAAARLALPAPVSPRSGDGDERSEGAEMPAHDDSPRSVGSPL